MLRDNLVLGRLYKLSAIGLKLEVLLMILDTVILDHLFRAVLRIIVISGWLASATSIDLRLPISTSFAKIRQKMADPKNATMTPSINPVNTGTYPSI